VEKVVSVLPGHRPWDIERRDEPYAVDLSLTFLAVARPQQLLCRSDQIKQHVDTSDRSWDPSRSTGVLCEIQRLFEKTLATVIRLQEVACTRSGRAQIRAVLRVAVQSAFRLHRDGRLIGRAILFRFGCSERR
jgi:hypothetical protein